VGDQAGSRLGGDVKNGRQQAIRHGERWNKILPHKSWTKRNDGSPPSNALRASASRVIVPRSGPTADQSARIGFRRRNLMDASRVAAVGHGRKTLCGGSSSPRAVFNPGDAFPALIGRLGWKQHIVGLANSFG
jgi:hypothetical protein